MKLNTASVASRSVCSRAKPTAHTGFGIETGTPLKNGDGWVRWYRITEEDVLRMNRDVYDYYESLNNLGKELGIPNSEMQQFRTEWLEQFKQNRKY
jgi:hypothetical protein